MDKIRKACVTGSSGLLGSEMVKFLCELGWEVYGLDNDRRGVMFGWDGSTGKIGRELASHYKTFLPHSVDIRDREGIRGFFTKNAPFDFIVHCAAQPAHEFSTNNAFEDFDINAVGTLNILENYRHFSSQAPFVHVSSSKVYGDSVNDLPLVKYKTRYDLPEEHKYYNGVDEEYCRIDGKLKSLFGSSKSCADLTAQEYANYFSLPIAIFRPVCITGSKHRGVALHGYLAYLIRCVAEGIKYTINGYSGLQVRDNIHAYDLATAFYEVYKNPKISFGECYNIGAGRESNNSIIEAFIQAEEILGKRAIYEFSDVERRGDHKWCIYSSDKFRKAAPEWRITYNNDRVMKEICSQYLIKQTV